MEQRTLGNSGLNITTVGLGTWAIGGEGAAFHWGPQDDQESIAAIHRAVERGINWIDTAPVYGLGHAETVVAEALAGLPRRDRPLVFTKCSLVWNEKRVVNHCLKADSIRREVETSLKRLQTEVLDLCQVHWPVLPRGVPAPDIEEGWTALVELVQEGKIKYIGVSNFDVPQLERVRKIAPVTSLQPPYSMLMRDVEDEILPYCLKHNIGVIAYSPMHNGLLSGSMTRERFAALPDSDWRKKVNTAFREPHLTRNLELVELLRGIGRRHRRTVADVAIAWTLRHAAVTGAIAGARCAAQVNGFAGALEFRLSDGEIAEIAAELPESVEMFLPDEAD
jgi:aryl-alcohol dehydrogenase-like predicted oxidoreductase